MDDIQIEEVGGSEKCDEWLTSGMERLINTSHTLEYQPSTKLYRESPYKIAQKSEVEETGDKGLGQSPFHQHIDRPWRTRCNRYLNEDTLPSNMRSPPEEENIQIKQDFCLCDHDDWPPLTQRMDTCSECQKPKQYDNEITLHTSIGCVDVNNNVICRNCIKCRTEVVTSTPYRPYSPQMEFSASPKSPTRCSVCSSTSKELFYSPCSSHSITGKQGNSDLNTPGKESNTSCAKGTQDVRECKSDPVLHTRKHSEKPVIATEQVEAKKSNASIRRIQSNDSLEVWPECGCGSFECSNEIDLCVSPKHFHISSRIYAGRHSLTPGCHASRSSISSFRDCPSRSQSLLNMSVSNLSDFRTCSTCSCLYLDDIQDETRWLPDISRKMNSLRTDYMYHIAPLESTVEEGVEEHAALDDTEALITAYHLADLTYISTGTQEMKGDAAQVTTFTPILQAAAVSCVLGKGDSPIQDPSESLDQKHPKKRSGVGLIGCKRINQTSEFLFASIKA